MNAPEQPFKPLPIDDDIVFKLIENTIINTDNGEILNSGKNPLGTTKNFIDKLAEKFLSMLYPEEIFAEGIKAKILEPGKKWVTGTIRLRLVVEFIPDELENNGTLDKFASSLDDMRSRNL